MKRARYTEQQVVGIQKDAEAGVAVTNRCRKYGIGDAPYYDRKAKYGGMTASDLKKLKQLQDENLRLKQIVADPTLDNQA